MKKKKGELKKGQDSFGRFEKGNRLQENNMTCKFSDAEVIEALANSGGVTKDAAATLGINYCNLVTRINRNPALKAARAEYISFLGDIAEDSLAQLIKDGEPATVRWACSKFKREKYGDDIVVAAQPVTITISRDGGTNAAE